VYSLSTFLGITTSSVTYTNGLAVLILSIVFVDTFVSAPLSWGIILSLPVSRSNWDSGINNWNSPNAPSAGLAVNTSIREEPSGGSSLVFLGLSIVLPAISTNLGVVTVSTGVGISVVSVVVIGSSTYFPSGPFSCPEYCIFTPPIGSTKSSAIVPLSTIYSL